MLTTPMVLRSPLHQARLAQLLVLGWMLIEAVVAVGSGIAARSIALTAFGAGSLIELFSAGAVLRHLLSRVEGAPEEALSQGERRASRLVGRALYAVAAYIVLSSGASLLFA